MKRVVLLLFLPFVTLLSFSQSIIITETPASFSKGTHISYQTDILQATLKGLEKDWTKYISTGSKSKVVIANGEYAITGAINKNISPASFNIYSKLLETTTGVKLTAWFTENDSTYLSKETNADQAMAIEKFIRDFAVAEYQDAVKSELKLESDNLSELEKELNGYIKEEEKAAKKVSESNRSIQRSNDNIASNNANIQNVSFKISDQMGMVERTASDANANKGAKQTLKDLENEKKKLQKSIETENKNIDNMNKQIRESERSIAENKEKQKTVFGKIEKQKQVVQAVQSKLDNIK